MRLLLALSGAVIALAMAIWPAIPVAASTTYQGTYMDEEPAGNSDPPPEEDPSTDDEKPTEQESPEDVTGDDENSNGESEKENAVDETTDQPGETPEGVRRKRPLTTAEERAYKQRKTREDPFLNPPVTSDTAGIEEIYNPCDWLRMDVVSDLSRYIVQDAGGAVVGYLTLLVERQFDPTLGEFIRLVRDKDYSQAAWTEVWIYADTLKPRRKHISPRMYVENNDAASPEDDPARVLSEGQAFLEVEYLFDRVTIKRHDADFTTSLKLRQPQSRFDIEQLPLLARQLDFHNIEWPITIVVLDPESAFTRAGPSDLPLTVDKPARVDVVSAEPRSRPCFALEIALGGEACTWWVERIPPHRLVKFEDGLYTYTLFEYIKY